MQEKELPHIPYKSIETRTGADNESGLEGSFVGSIVSFDHFHIINRGGQYSCTVFQRVVLLSNEL